MKTIRFTLTLLVLALLVPATTMRASIEVTPDQARTEMIKKVVGQKDQITKAFKAEKKKARKYKRKMAKKGQRVDFNDPVDKWMWFWIFGWGAGLVLSIIAAASVTGGIYSGSIGFAAILGTLAWLAWLFGTVALVIWLVKKFGGA